MHPAARALALALVVGATALPTATPAWADPPGGFKNGKGHGHGRGQDDDGDRGRERGGGPAVEFRFEDRDRIVVHDYFLGVAERGHCPPGLAKKHNGCMPPGQAKRWAVGRPLPRDVVFYELPADLVVRLRPAPTGYRYVRVASDVLMIAVGTGLVAAAIEDLGR